MIDFSVRAGAHNAAVSASVKTIRGSCLSPVQITNRPRNAPASLVAGCVEKLRRSARSTTARARGTRCRQQGGAPARYRGRHHDLDARGGDRVHESSTDFVAAGSRLAVGSSRNRIRDRARGARERKPLLLTAGVRAASRPDAEATCAAVGHGLSLRAATHRRRWRRPSGATSRGAGTHGERSPGTACPHQLSSRLWGTRPIADGSMCSCPNRSVPAARSVHPHRASGRDRARRRLRRCAARCSQD